MCIKQQRHNIEQKQTDVNLLMIKKHKNNNNHSNNNKKSRRTFIHVSWAYEKH